MPLLEVQVTDSLQTSYVSYIQEFSGVKGRAKSCVASAGLGGTQNDDRIWQAKLTGKSPGPIWGKLRRGSDLSLPEELELGVH